MLSEILKGCENDISDAKANAKHTRNKRNWAVSQK